MRVCTKSLRSIMYNVSIVDTHGKGLQVRVGSLFVFHMELFWGYRRQICTCQRTCVSCETTWRWHVVI